MPQRPLGAWQLGWAKIKDGGKPVADFSSTTLPQDNSKPEIDKAILDLLKKVNDLNDALTASTTASKTPPGLIAPYGGATAPDGWLLCNGTAVLRGKYPDLFKAIGTNWGVGDGSSTFNIPDQAEAAFVGVGTRGSGVTAHDTYMLGQFKDDQLQGHRHLQQPSNTGSGGSGINATGGFSSGNTTGDPASDGTNGTPRTGTTTRGKRLGVNYIIKT